MIARVSAPCSCGAGGRLPWLVPGLLGVMLFWGGAQSFQTYVRPYLETVTGLDAGGVSLVLLLVGVASFVSTLGGVLIDNVSMSAPVVASAIVLTAVAVHVGLIMRASRPATAASGVAGS